MVFIVILILSFLLQLILPWWVIILISFVICGLIGKTGKIALWSPFFAVSLLWTGMALLKSLPNNNILATRVAGMFSLPYWWLVLLVTALLAGFAAGISGYCGYQFRKAVLVKKTQD
jgi:hypothetical protein